MFILLPIYGEQYAVVRFVPGAQTELRQGGATERPIKASIERVVRFLIVLAVVALVLGVALSNFAAHQDKLDFSLFYGAGQIVRQGLGRNLYDLTTQIEFQSRVAAVHAFYTRPPFEALLFLPFAYFDYRAAYTLWTLAGLGLLLSAALLIESGVKVSLAVSQYAKMPADFGLVFILFLTFGPATTCLLIGQDSVLVLLIYALMFVLLKRGRDFSAGCVLACGLFKFQLIVPFVVILLLRRRWSALKGFAAIATLLAVVSAGVCGFQILASYPRLLLSNTYQEVGRSSASMVEMRSEAQYMPNLRGVLYLLTAGRLPASAFGLLVVILSALAVWWAARNWRDEQLGASFAAALTATLLASHHSHNYDLVVLLLPTAIVCGELARQGRLVTNRLLTGVLAVIFLPPVHLVLAEHGMYALMGIPVLVLFFVVIRVIHFTAPQKSTNVIAATQ